MEQMGNRTSQTTHEANGNQSLLHFACPNGPLEGLHLLEGERINIQANRGTTNLRTADRPGLLERGDGGLQLRGNGAQRHSYQQTRRWLRGRRRGRRRRLGFPS
uniref:Uncharacterized protein n=1 Tax=Aegilops tauschii subsp. strangulata TaxID=200361 RepID=A0A453DW15_AEGTS